MTDDVDPGGSNRHVLVNVRNSAIGCDVKGDSSRKTPAQDAVSARRRPALIRENGEVSAVLLRKLGVILDRIRADHKVSKIQCSKFLDAVTQRLTF